MSQSLAYQLVQKFYDFFNAEDFEAYRNILAEDFSHQVNFEELDAGVNPFIEFLQDNQKHYKEKIENPLIMVSEDGRHASAKCVVTGEYVLTDESGIQAQGQTYRLDVIHFFEIKDEKVSRGCGWYDQSDWEKQVKTLK